MTPYIHKHILLLLFLKSDSKLSSLSTELLNGDKDVLIKYLIDNKMYAEYKTVVNFLHVLNSLCDDDISTDVYEPSSTEFDKINCLYTRLSLDYGVKIIDLDMFLGVITTFFIIKDMYDEWSCELSSTCLWRYISLDRCLTKSSSEFKHIILKFLKIDNLSYFFPRVKHRDDDYLWYLLRYSIIIKYGIRFKYFGLILSGKNYKAYGIGDYTTFSQLLPPNNWYLIISPVVYDNIGSILYDRKNINLKPISTQYNGKNNVSDILDNSLYTSPIWIRNGRSILNSESQQSSGFLDLEANNKLIVDNINKLNMVAFRVSLDEYEYIMGLVVNNDFITNYLSECYESAKSISSKTSIIRIIRSEIELLLKFGNKFYFNYMIDMRIRGYVFNIPINYQLDKLVRSFVTFDGTQNINRIYIKFLRHNNNVYKHKIFYIQKINRDVLSNIESHVPELGNYLTKFYDSYTNISIRNIKKLVIFEGICVIFHKLGKELGKHNLNQTLLNGAIAVKSISQNDPFTQAKLNTKNPKKLIENISKYLTIKKWSKNPTQLPNTICYNDASANVIQLLAMKLFIYDEKFLEITNIFNNNTAYSDIYDYVTQNVKKLHTNNECVLITRELIKSRIMPGTYGQRLFTFIKNSSKLLNNSTYWQSLSKKEQINFIITLDKHIWTCLGEEGLLLKEYLELCMHLAYEYPEECRWIGKLDLPIIIEEQKIIKRKNIRDEIKRLMSKLKETTDNTLINTINNKITQLNNTLKKDDTNYIRKNLKLNKNDNTLIKTRYRKKNVIIDKAALSNSLAASSNHSDDATILWNTVNDLQQLGISLTIIHDSIGCKYEYSTIVKTIFKINNIKFIERLIKIDEFPFNLLTKEFKNKKYEEKRLNFLIKRNNNKIKFIKNLEHIKRRIMESDDFFN